VSSRFVDPTLTHAVDLGDGESAQVRSRLSGLEVARFANATDEEAAVVAAAFIPSWTLCDDDGPVPVSAAALLRLDATTMSLLSTAIGDVVAASLAPVPNGSGAPSRSTSRASAHPTRTIRPRP